MIALITGASRGLGFALGRALASKYHVVAVARTVGALEELDDSIQAKGGNATLVPLDLTDAEGVSRMCAAIFERWGGIDLWLHTAAHATSLSPAHHIAADDIATTIQVHVHATSDLISKVDPLLRARNGTAVFMQDDQLDKKFFGSYAAGKAAEAALFRAWAAETIKSGPTVLGFSPNPMPTGTRARFFPGEDKSALYGCANEAQRLISEHGL
ncbi:MAG: SDR family oxidoreductase [Pseudomonadota bacterium]